MSNIVNLMRLQKLSPVLTLAIPSFWAATLAKCSISTWTAWTLLMCIILLGSFIARSAECIINDILDRKIDILNDRTKNRPIASGKISIMAAILILIPLVLVGLVILMLLNNVAVMIILCGTFLAALYPLAKRFYRNPSFILGIIINIGVFAIFIQCKNYIDTSCVMLYISGVYWIMLCDTIYAYQDIKSDMLLHINSAAILYNINGKQKMHTFAIMTCFCQLLAAIFAPCNFIYFYIMLIFLLLFLYKIINELDLNNARTMAIGFEKAIYAGLLPLIGLLLDQLTR